MLKSSGVPITRVARCVESIARLASDNRLTTQAIYKYVASDRDIRVFKGAIYEIKKLEGKQ